MASLKKRSILLSGHATSMALEPEFWAAAERLADRRGQSLSAFVLDIDRTRGDRNLASAVRVAVLAHLTASASLAERASS